MLHKHVIENIVLIHKYMIEKIIMRSAGARMPIYAVLINEIVHYTSMYLSSFAVNSVNNYSQLTVKYKQAEHLKYF